jgi:hypothetical protein
VLVSGADCGQDYSSAEPTIVLVLQEADLEEVLSCGGVAGRPLLRGFVGLVVVGKRGAEQDLGIGYGSGQYGDMEGCPSK